MCSHIFTELRLPGNSRLIIPDGLHKTGKSMFNYLHHCLEMSLEGLNTMREAGPQPWGGVKAVLQSPPPFSILLVFCFVFFSLSLYCWYFPLRGRPTNLGVKRPGECHSHQSRRYFRLIFSCTLHTELNYLKSLHTLVKPNALPSSRAVESS